LRSQARSHGEPCTVHTRDGPSTGSSATIDAAVTCTPAACMHTEQPPSPPACERKCAVTASHVNGPAASTRSVAASRGSTRRSTGWRGWRGCASKPGIVVRFAQRCPSITRWVACVTGSRRGGNHSSTCTSAGGRSELFANRGAPPAGAGPSATRRSHITAETTRTLDADPSFAPFLLDGQMAVVDDYRAVRPGAQAALRRLAASGRLATGPWYILMDEFLVSGETIVRNLQMGLDRAAEFGGAMPVGYLPDMFGHIAQMPQLLRQFGLEHAVVWRGVPSSVDRSAFWWSAPDGSTVRAEYLVQGYGNGAYLPDDAKALVAAIADFEHDWEGFLTGPILWMNGTDHLVPQLRLGRLVAEANEIQDDYELIVTSLADHLAHASVDDLPSWTGELRSGARANLLMGVTSNRVDVRQAAARAERALERAETLAALFLGPERWPDALLHEAWLQVVRNAAHDSICACSIDEVCDAVLVRYREAARIGEGLAQRALDALGASVAGDAPVAVNPTARTRSGLVEIVVPGEGPRPGAQILSERPAERVLTELDLGSMAGVVVRELKHNRRIEAIALESVDTGEELWRAERERDGSMLDAGTRAELDALAASNAGTVRIKIRTKPTQKLVVRMTDVPGHGWRCWEPAPLDVAPVDAGGSTMTNGLVRVEVAADG